LVKRQRETGSITPRQQTKFRRRALSETEEERLVALITAQPDPTLAELQRAFPTAAALSTLWRVIGRRGITSKKTVHADEQRRPDVAAARRQWHDALALHDARGYVFLDDSGVTTDLLRRYGRSLRGLRLRVYTPMRPLADPHGDRGVARQRNASTSFGTGYRVSTAYEKRSSRGLRPDIRGRALASVPFSMRRAGRTRANQRCSA
jgi:hypothetical protein